MGPIQTAIGQMLGAASATAIVGKKLNEDARQAREEETKLAEKEAKAAQKKDKSKKEDEIVSKALLEAQQNGTASPSSIIFDKSGKPLATYQEMAELLSSQRMDSTLTARLRTMVATQERRKILEAKKKEREEKENAKK